VSKVPTLFKGTAGSQTPTSFVFNQLPSSRVRTHVWQAQCFFPDVEPVWNPAITSVILGASRVEQLTDTLAAADCKLDSALKTRLDEVSIEFRRGDAG